MKKNNTFLSITIAILLALGGILLPGYFLQKKNTASLNSVQNVPDKYYSSSNSAIARNVSARLTSYERALLVSGVWESEITKAKEKENGQSEHDAVLLAQKKLEPFYESGVYPVSLTPDSGNWYSWETELYKATDSTFHTYTAYFWRIHFTRYEGSQQHIVFMLDDGTILSADARMKQPTFQDIKPYIIENFTENGIKPSIITNNRNLTFPAYYKMDLSNLRSINSYYMIVGNNSVTDYLKLRQLYQSDTKDRTEIYYVYQMTKEHEYLFCLIPYDGK